MGIKQTGAKIIGFAKRRKKLSTTLGIILVIVAFITGRNIYKSFKPPEFGTAEVVRKDLLETIEVSGEVKAHEVADLHFQTAGKLAWIGVKEGDSVTKWQAVAGQDKRTLEGQLKQDLIAFEKEFRDFDQTKEDTRLVNLSFKRILEEAQYDLDNEVIDVEIRNLAIELATLVTPITGVVTRVDAPIAGVNITAADTIQVVNPETLYFEAEVDESDIASVGEELNAAIILDAYSDTEIESRVTSIDYTSSISDGGGTVFLVNFDLPKPEGVNYRLGLNGDASIITKKEENALALPLDAVDEDDQGSFVVVYKNKNFTKQAVTIGIESDEDVEVVSGLAQGDWVVLSGTIPEGMQIVDGR
ncbi:MAG: hypothetical protein A2785_00850 [Candidatus Chisholmbacteria bacterium RIFCSPHIGHO2_01_FULL_49_18]|uniref:Multidrug resistance protein MdtA-like C-terminal permuted SH3 domain-containing protein n=2 Tax=Candidatus Chisholmiibacteriota TaxID=1817900 RepID=A0A1G1VL46_9BACT|nr:MAG: hypothetical protein A2785_00850 [Candidatus Chisholmbacteria bacterium RIFCSPHIGHO2_01_FULL_49_18]OGY22218.1 MAG: hypothetical protein A3A65_04980 [Candidatus Chisholmbacteria bacterium RIFCSPLOWO2_01_FULL_49_14]